MTPELLACPYCNTQLPHPPPEVSRVRCTRCNETFPVRPVHLADAVQAEAPPPPTLEPAPVLPPEKPTPRWILQLALLSIALVLTSLALKVALPDNNTTQRAFPFMVMLSAGGVVASLWLWFLQQPRSNNALAGFVLANMVTAAVAILPFALGTTDFRRGNDPKPPPIQLDLPLPTAVAPAEVAGLGYLPDDFNVVAAVHVAELAKLPIGAKVLTAPKADTPEAEPRPWLLDQGLGRVEKLTGLKPDAIDHLVFGMKAETATSSLMLVVRTRKPYDAAAIAAVQAPVVPTKYNHKDLYQFAVQLGGKGAFQPAGQGLLWCADAQTLILIFNLALADRDKHLLTDRPRTGGQLPPRPLQPFLSQRLARGTLVWWAAAGLERPELVAGLLPLGKDAAMVKITEKARRFTMGLQVEPKDASVLGNIECEDRDSARRLKELLELKTVPGLGTPKVTELGPGGVDSWVSFQLRGTPEAVLGTLGPVRLFAMPGKG